MSMKYRQHLYLRKGYLRFTFESSITELPSDITNVCKTLCRGKYVVEVFDKDPLFQSILIGMPCACKQNNLCFYITDGIDFLHHINVANIRHMCIYTTSELHEHRINRKYLINHSPFVITFSNYLDTCELIVCQRFYSQKLIDELLR